MEQQTNQNGGLYAAALDRLSKLALELIERVAVEKHYERASLGNRGGIDLITGTGHDIEDAIRDVNAAYDREMPFLPKGDDH